MTADKADCVSGLLMHSSDTLAKKTKIINKNRKWLKNVMPHSFQNKPTATWRLYLLSLISWKGLFDVLQVQDLKNLGIVHIHPESSLQFILSREQDVHTRWSEHQISESDSGPYWNDSISQAVHIDNARWLFLPTVVYLESVTSGQLRTVNSLSCSW